MPFRIDTGLICITFHKKSINYKILRAALLTLHVVQFGIKENTNLIRKNKTERSKKIWWQVNNFNFSHAF